MEYEWSLGWTGGDKVVVAVVVGGDYEGGGKKHQHQRGEKMEDKPTPGD